MAQAMLIDSKIILRFETGMDDNGKPTFKNKTYPRVKKESTPEQLLQAANALAGLSEFYLSTVQRTDNHDIF